MWVPSGKTVWLSNALWRPNNFCYALQILCGFPLVLDCGLLFTLQDQRVSCIGLLRKKTSDHLSFPKRNFLSGKRRCNTQDSVFICASETEVFGRKKVQAMIKKIVTKRNLNEHKFSSMKDDLAYWLSRLPEERIAAVEYLRRQYHGSTTGLQRSARVIQRPSG